MSSGIERYTVERCVVLCLKKYFGPKKDEEQGEFGQKQDPDVHHFLKHKLLRLPWKPEYKGQVNLHVFEDWCGSSISQLKNNLHFPLYPHSRTTVKKLAVSPKWKNYGLRAFGYIHPYRDGEFQFAISSDDNSELWLSSDDNPLNTHLLAYVGMHGSEWTAPGEFTKFRSQISKPMHLTASRRYYFEVLHKQDDRGSDHVEVAWRPFLPGLKFDIIDSPYISLYTDESWLMMDNVSHVPQTVASHAAPPESLSRVSFSGPRPRLHADMLTPDPRDTFYHIPLISASGLLKVLPPCVYSPTYVLKDFPIARYQGLQFVYLSFVYPNDFTRLTHMENDNKCFYKESPLYLEKYGFYKYMKMDEEEDDTPFFFPNPDDFLDEEEGADPEDPGEDRRTSDNQPIRTSQNHSTANPSAGTSSKPSSPPATEDREEHLYPQKTPDKRGSEMKEAIEEVEDEEEGGRGDRDAPSARLKTPDSGERSLEVMPGVFLHRTGGAAAQQARQQPIRCISIVHILLPCLPHRRTPCPVTCQMAQRTVTGPRGPADGPEYSHGSPWGSSSTHPAAGGSPSSTPPGSRALPGQRSSENSLPNDDDDQDNAQSRSRSRGASSSRASEPFASQAEALDVGSQAEERAAGGTSDYSEEHEEELRPDWEEKAINWQRTFSANTVDFETLRSDWNDLRCNVSGNLQLAEGEALDIASQYMERLNKRHAGVYTLHRILNVEKRRDSARGNRFLLELVLLEGGQKKVRVSEYVYLLFHRSRLEDSLEMHDGTAPASPSHPVPSKSPVPSPSRSSAAPQERATPAWSTNYARPLLCKPTVLRWRHDVMVHFVVPVKNQARWVVQFISDMEALRRETRDDNFSVVIVDFQSEDMDVERALRESSLPRYEYLRRAGRFERAAGLQAGVDSIQDSHSIVFLCDLHIHFPASLLESVRKHCVEGRLAFAPIVMRLNCGTTPRQPEGYWEVNGFGLLGLYKSDFDRVGGMNTEEFKERWGGEDWELLDRVLQHGLEVERLRLRNFFHYYHSKRGMWNSQTKNVPKG
ncbi:N-acetyl-beta-glucosaminyl-glycoprotein 4-beta-N-acetylgalactosaminyltransferase 1-like [Engraulis encrasicolus]|uniref:N-acetyl-beta-glucosaminyl-glycoprotein 4-beta-N-acetylgalactosaminyltransferase 1-like n=1 Tax=Engraulis encrasicolus TaxID=184585 RepID=UPI002FD6B966